MGRGLPPGGGAPAGTLGGHISPHPSSFNIRPGKTRREVSCAARVTPHTASQGQLWVSGCTLSPGPHPWGLSLVGDSDAIATEPLSPSFHQGPDRMPVSGLRAPQVSSLPLKTSVSLWKMGITGRPSQVVVRVIAGCRRAPEPPWVPPPGGPGSPTPRGPQLPDLRRQFGPCD